MKVEIKSSKPKSLKNKIHQYICKKQDICCEEDIDRDSAIKEIIDLYMKISDFYKEKDEYLTYIENDLLKFIGYYVVLKNTKDREGMILWKSLQDYVNTSNKTQIIELLHEVPLYYLLSFLGMAYYKYKDTEKM